MNGWFVAEGVEDGFHLFHFFAVMNDDVVELLRHQLVDRFTRPRG